MIRFLFVADSRGHKFATYRKPEDKAFPLALDFVIIGGAKIYNLIGPTIRKLNSYSASDRVVVRLAAGINDLTAFRYDLTHEYRVLKPSNHCAESLFFELDNFKRAIQTARPYALVSFATIPPMSFCKFQESRKLLAPLLSKDDIQTFQRNHDAVIDEVNTKIVTHNSIPQSGVVLRTLSWHNSVRKLEKRTRRGKVRCDKRNHFAHLYDGLHGDSKLKQRWFSEMYKSFLFDYTALQQSD